MAVGKPGSRDEAAMVLAAGYLVVLVGYMTRVLYLLEPAHWVQPAALQPDRIDWSDRAGFVDC